MDTLLWIKEIVLVLLALCNLMQEIYEIFQFRDSPSTISNPYIGDTMSDKPKRMANGDLSGSNNDNKLIETKTKDSNTSPPAERPVDLPEGMNY